MPSDGNEDLQIEQGDTASKRHEELRTKFAPSHLYTIADDGTKARQLFDNGITEKFP